MCILNSNIRCRCSNKTICMAIFFITKFEVHVNFYIMTFHSFRYRDDSFDIAKVTFLLLPITRKTHRKLLGDNYSKINFTKKNKKITSAILVRIILRMCSRICSNGAVNCTCFTITITTE